MTSKNSLVKAFALAAGLVAASMSAPARAATTCTPTAVNTDNNRYITVNCGGTWYYAQPSVCSNSQDSVKQFLSLIQAAILAGKNLEIATNSTSGCTNHLIWLQLVK